MRSMHHDNLPWLLPLLLVVLLAWCSAPQADELTDSAVLTILERDDTLRKVQGRRLPRFSARDEVVLLVSLAEDPDRPMPAGAGAGRRAERRTSIRERKQALLAAQPEVQEVEAWEHVPVMKVRVKGRRALVQLLRDERVQSVAEDSPLELHLDQFQAAANVPVSNPHVGVGVSVAVLDGYPWTGEWAPGLEGRVGAIIDGAGDGSQVGSLHATSIGQVIAMAAPGVDIVFVDIVPSSGQILTSHALKGINWVLANHERHNIRAVNLSFGISTQSYAGTCEQSVFAAAAATLWKAGVATVASTGNGGKRGTITDPGCAPGVLAVASTYDATTGYTAQYNGICTEPETRDRVVCTSNLSARVDLYAPGCTLTTYMRGSPADPTPTVREVKQCGTSMAAPVVAAAAARLMAADMAPWANPTQVRDLLQETGKAVSTRDGVWKGKRVDYKAAIEKATQIRLAKVSEQIATQAVVQHAAFSQITATNTSCCTQGVCHGSR